MTAGSLLARAAAYRPSGRLRLYACAVACAIAIAAVFIVGMERSPTDAFVYLLAGERLNAGHEVYRLLPGDYPIAANPPYWTVPLLSPPLTAVVWRPLAALGVTGLFAGWLGTAVAFLAALVLISRRNPVLGLAGVVLLAIPIGWQLGLGNVNGFLLLGLVLIWDLRNRPVAAGSLLALLVALKVTPVVLVWWFVTRRARRSIAVFLIASGCLAMAAAVGAGPGSLPDYVQVMLHTTSAGASEMSLAGIARSVGVPSWAASLAPWCALLAGAVAMVLLRHRERASFSVAVLTMVFASPVVNLYWFALLLGALAPYSVALPAQEPRPDGYPEPAASVPG